MGRRLVCRRGLCLVGGWPGLLRTSFCLGKKIATGLSDISYTLYLVHFPLLAFVFFVFFEGQRYAPDATIYLWFLSLLAMVVAYAIALWWCFERNTDRLRKRVESFLGIKKESRL